MSYEQSDVSYRPINTAIFLSGDGHHGAVRSTAKATHKQVWDAAKKQVINVLIAGDEPGRSVDPCCSPQHCPIPGRVSLLARGDSFTAENQSTASPAVQLISPAPQQPKPWDEVIVSAFQTAAEPLPSYRAPRSPGGPRPPADAQAAIWSFRPPTPYLGATKQSSSYNGAVDGVQPSVGNTNSTTASADSALKLLRELQDAPEDSGSTCATRPTSSSKAAGRLRVAVRVASAAAALCKPAKQLQPATASTGAPLASSANKCASPVSPFAAAALTGLSDEGISSMLAGLSSRSSIESKIAPLGRRVVFCDVSNSSYSSVQQQQHTPFARSKSTGLLPRSSMRQPMGGAKDDTGDDAYEAPTDRANMASCDQPAAAAQPCSAKLQASNGSYQQPSSLVASATLAARRQITVPAPAPGASASGSIQGCTESALGGCMPRQRPEPERKLCRLPPLNRSKTNPL